MGPPRPALPRDRERHHAACADPHDRLRTLTPEQRARREARWVPPIVVWLASQESGHVTGRVFEVGGGFFAVMEGWHRGPAAEPVEDPAAVGPIVTELTARARRNAGMDGEDLD